MPANVCSRLGRVDLNGGVSRASHIAPDSSYRLSVPPIRALTTEWDDPLPSTENPAAKHLRIHSRAGPEIGPNCN
jgi:hypothetical protein